MRGHDFILHEWHYSSSAPFSLSIQFSGGQWALISLLVGYCGNSLVFRHSIGEYHDRDGSKIAGHHLDLLIAYGTKGFENAGSVVIYPAGV
jgi:hypothetical protein